MDPHSIVTYGLMALTFLFALMLLAALVYESFVLRAMDNKSLIDARKAMFQEAMRKAFADGAEAARDADVSEKLMEAAGTFGKDVRTIGPRAIAAVFTAIFAVLTTISALIP